MIYIDIDNTLTDFDGYLLSKDSRAIQDGHILFKTIYRYYKEAYLQSKPLVDFSFIKRLEGNVALLTSLPDDDKIRSFCKSDDECKEIMQTLRYNKISWAKSNFQEIPVYIVESRTQKVKFCKSPDDILIDDSKSTGKSWMEAGGKHFLSVMDFISGNMSKNKLSLKQSLDFKEDKIELW